MHADIAVGERAEDGVDQGMQHHVGVGMARQSARMRDAHAAEHHVIAVAELVYVEAEARAHVAQGRELGRLGAGEIVVGSELHVCGLAFEGRHFEAGPFGERGIVGEVRTAGGKGPPMRVE
jgi:hypothetical protein